MRNDGSKIVDTLTGICYIGSMKALTVAEIKARFSDVLVCVKLEPAEAAKLLKRSFWEYDLFGQH
jgi:hypothetical protein